MDRYAAQRLSVAIQSLPGYRTSVVQCSEGWVVDVTDAVLHRKERVTGPEQWTALREETQRARQLAASRSLRETPELGEEPAHVEVTTKPAAPQTNGHAPVATDGAFDWDQYLTITQAARRHAERQIEQLREKRAELDADIARRQGEVKKLDQVLRMLNPTAPTTARTATQKASASHRPAELILAWVQEHDGRLVTTELYENLIARGVYPTTSKCASNLSNYFTQLVRDGKLERVSPGQYRQVG